MKVLSAFPSKYLRASDLDAPVLYTMAHVHEEPMPDGEHKPVLYFEEINKGLVLNITNTRTIVAHIGTDDDSAWLGKKIVLFSATVQGPKGTMVEGIRVRPPKQNGAAAAKPQRAPAPAADMDDEIPF